MADIERNAKWYHPWPLVNQGLDYTRQLRTIRWNTEEAGAIIRSSLLDIDDDAPYFQSNKVYRGQEYGRLEFRNKFRVYYDDDGSYQYFVIQRNTGTVTTPVWSDVMRVEEDIGHVTFGDGGVSSTGGFYHVHTHPGKIDNIGYASSSGLLIEATNAGTLFFNRDDGFYITLVQSGVYAGQPIINKA